MNFNAMTVRFALFAAFLALLVAGATVRSPAASTQPPAEVASQVKAIDTDCLAIQNAIQALKPIHIVNTKSTWKVESDEDVAVAERTKASVTIDDVWKQGSNYAWVHSHSYDQKGNQSATQLCFRQKDGSLERAKQAADVPGLNGAAAAVGYYTPDGTVIFKSETFEVNDPKLAKKITDLPFYKDLP